MRKNKKAHVFSWAFLCFQVFFRSSDTNPSRQVSRRGRSRSASCPGESVAEQLLAQFASFLRFERQRGCRTRDQAGNADRLPPFLPPPLIPRPDPPPPLLPFPPHLSSPA